MTSKNILVIGSKNHSLATKCIDWGEEEYVGDYDAVIFDLDTLTKKKLTEIFAEKKDYFEKMKGHIIDCQKNRGLETFCVLSPIIFSDDVSEHTDPETRKKRNNYSWCPIIPLLEKVPEAKKLNKKESGLEETYLSKILKYNLVLADCINNTGFKDEKGRDGIYTELYRFNLLENEVGKVVAFRVSWKVHRNHQYDTILVSNDPVIFLPPTENRHDGIEILIKNLRTDLEEKAPDWAKDFVVPGSGEEITLVENSKKEINEITARISEAEQRIKDLNDYRKLLYASGTELEAIVEKSFSLLGIKINSPELKNLEDRFFQTPDSQKIYIEIRGVNRLMSEADLSQLIKRVAEKPTSSLYNARGIYIFNHQNKLAPKDRDEAFGSNIVKQALGFSFCLIDTKTLYYLVVKKLSGENDTTLQDQILNNEGVFKIEEVKPEQILSEISTIKKL